jgi:hypothetical protein
MMTSRENVPTNAWLPKDQSFSVEITPSLLDEIRTRAVAGLTSFRHGGLEIGGVLYGVRGEKSALITGYAQLAAEHALGPAFRLSETDLKSYEALLEAPPGMQTLGYFRSHTRRDGVDLDDTDRYLFDRFFPSEGHVALVVKPSILRQTTAAFFVRSESRGILDSPPEEFTIEPLRGAHRIAAQQPEEDPVGPDQNASTEDPDPDPHALAGPAVDEVPALASQASPAASRNRLRYWWAAPLAASIFILMMLYRTPFGPHPLALKVEAFAPGEVRIGWNYLPGPFPNGATGSLEIQDGDMDVSVPLDSDRLGLNTVVYPHKSKNLQIRMRVDLGRPDNRQLEEAIRFEAPPVVVYATALPQEPLAQPEQPTRSVDRQADPLPAYHPGTSELRPPQPRRPARVSKAPARKARQTAETEASADRSQPVVQGSDREVDRPHPVVAPEPMIAKTDAVEVSDPGPHYSDPPPHEPEPKAERAPGPPQNGGNRFVRALGKLNPLRRLRRGSEPKAPIQ